MNNNQQCPENYTNLITGLIASITLLISEVLPFIKSMEGNGVVHALIKKFLPEQETTNQHNGHNHV